jgi:hypothetical protein
VVDESGYSLVDTVIISVTEEAITTPTTTITTPLVGDLDPLLISLMTGIGVGVVVLLLLFAVGRGKPQFSARFG